MTKLGRDLIRSAEEAAAIASGEADPATYRVHVPAEMDKASTGERTPPLPAGFRGIAFGGILCCEIFEAGF
ncbi:MAG TPA: hypothetical protein VKB16_03910 [Beijerinckiaceae bacterium]|nr:hypothetical protein [Beijerinckiaceae bacterium]